MIIIKINADQPESEIKKILSIELKFNEEIGLIYYKPDFTISIPLEAEVCDDFCGQLDEIISTLSISEPFFKSQTELIEIAMEAREKLIKLKNNSKNSR